MLKCVWPMETLMDWKPDFGIFCIPIGRFSLFFMSTSVNQMIIDTLQICLVFVTLICFLID